MNDDDETEEDADRPKKKKPKKDTLQKNKKNDPNAPPSNRIPLPELSVDQNYPKFSSTSFNCPSHFPLFQYC